MASDNLYLGIRTQPDKYRRIKLENIDLEDKVSELKKRAARKVNLLTQKIELIYCGLILDDTCSLSSCGIKSGVTIHVFEKPKAQPPTQDAPLTELHVQRLVVAFRTFGLSANYRNALQRLTRPDILENIIAATPGLADDPIAISIIRDHELITQLADPDTVRRVVELHPTLIVAAHHIAAYVHEEAANLNLNHAGTSTGYSYSLEALSDDDDDDEMDSPSETSTGSLPLTRNSSYNAITAAQLAAAIANANNSNASNPPASNTASTPTASGNISSELLNSALLMALGGGGSSATNTPRGTGSLQYMQPQLQQMREMGLINNSINLRALQATSGDVQAAVELVLSGAFD